jgi:hypothetical protein
MRRAMVIVTTVLASFALVAPQASADPVSRGGGHPRPPVGTGSFEGAGVFELFTRCTFAWEVVDGTFEGSRPGRADDGTFTFDYCVTSDSPTHTFGFDGTFTLETKTGVVLAGTLSGGINLDPAGSPIDITLTVEESSGTRRPISGTITLTGTRTEPGDGTYASTVWGTYVADLAA